MAPPRIEIPSELLARARVLYENGTSLEVIGRLLGVSGQTVRNRAIEQGWSRSRPSRPPVPDDDWPDAPPPMREPAEEDAAPEAIARRLGRLIARELLRTETYDHSPEAAARTLAMLARSASTLHALHGRSEPGGDAEQDVREPMSRYAVYQVFARVIARFEEIYDQEGKEALINQIGFVPYLEGLGLLIIGDREGRAAKAEAAARPEVEEARRIAATSPPPF